MGVAMDHGLQKTPLGLYRSLLHQLLSKFPGALLDLVDNFTERQRTIGSPSEKWQWHWEELRGFLKTSLSKILESTPIVIFVDALDESGEMSAVGLVQDFKKLLQELPETKFHFRIFFSCRLYPILESDYESGDGLTILVNDNNSADIERYVQESLSRLPSHRDNYASLIASRAAGVFLWAALVVKQVLDLEREANNHITIKKEIEKIPQDLDELYRNLIRNLKRPQTTLRLVQWVCFACRPLTTDELRWAIAVDPDGQHESLQDCRNSVHFVEDDKITRGINVLTCGLVEVTRSWKPTVQFIHQSKKQTTCYGESLAVQLLIEANADIHSVDDRGCTALSRAAANGHTATAQLLLDKGADLNSRDNQGQTSLHRAAAHGKTDIIRLLLDTKVAIDSADRWGRTPLSQAARMGEATVVQLLIAAGADVNSSYSGQTILVDVLGVLMKTGEDRWEQERYDQVAKLLIAASAHTGSKDIDAQAVLAYVADVISKILANISKWGENRWDENAWEEYKAAVRVWTAPGVDMGSVDVDSDSLLICTTQRLKYRRQMTSEGHRAVFKLWEEARVHIDSTAPGYNHCQSPVARDRKEKAIRTFLGTCIEIGSSTLYDYYERRL
ncbi:putative Pfs NB-ARC and ankyrin-domain-containing protein [Xylaria sp. FL1042]|nr:putative Pfs NB-ARC and ankyrin-domain-containing protein [Xylaria sp. FL1042]